MKNACGSRTEKRQKKNLKDALVRRHARGQREGGEGHTSYDSLPKGACRMMQDYAKSSARRGDLLRRAADLIASRIPPGRIDWVVGGRVVFFVFVVLSVFPVFVGLLAFLLCC